MRIPMSCLFASALIVLALAASPARGGTAPPPPLALGTVRVVAETPCESSRCVAVEVATPEARDAVPAALLISEPAALPALGTILFLTGGKGTAFWEEFGPDARRVLSELNQAGFRTVQIRWTRSWLTGAPAQFEGPHQLASRAATLADWIHDTLFDPDPGAAFCATGNSAGAGEIAYMLVDYGLADELSAVVLTGGPPFARVDLGCLRGSPLTRPYVYSGAGRRLLDRSFGFPDGENGPCSRGDAAFTPLFQSEGLVPDHGQYAYPATMTWFVFGEDDTTSAVTQGMLFYDALVATGTPLVGYDNVPNTPHSVPSTREGADRVRDLLLQDCHPR